MTSTLSLPAVDAMKHLLRQTILPFAQKRLGRNPFRSFFRTKKGDRYTQTKVFSVIR